MKSVGSLLSSLLKNLGIEDKIALSSLQKEWRSLFNEPLSLHTYPTDMKNGELSVNVDSPAWLAQLKFFKQEMTKKLAAYGIKEIRFKHGTVYHKSGQGTKGKRQNDFEQKSKHIAPSDLQWIDETVSAVADTELKEDIKRAIESTLRSRKNKSL
ncbi:MAG: DUF721 domain-containing protein [Nitrospirae bacterium]|nr:DUF721 domain-containing protein [Nitrospirota bacterium]MCL5977923.1 DUF721 domain-containing protein [Nitrospirota bacterium]